MKRREFMAASAAVAAVPAATAAAAEAGAGKEYYELRTYKLLPGTKKLMADFVKEAEIPALNRLGVGKVGVFNSLFGGDNSSLYMLIPYPTLEAFATAEAKLAADSAYQAAGASVLNCPPSNPAYVRLSRQLFLAFDGMPKLAAPVSGNDRIFELRCYESHSRERGRKKIEMFNKGEIEIFHQKGLKPVFFGEALTGDNLPNLTYMLAHESLEARQPAWTNFGSSPEWKEMSGREEYKDTVSTIAVTLLKPTPSSQI